MPCYFTCRVELASCKNVVFPILCKSVSKKETRNGLHCGIEYLIMSVLCCILHIIHVIYANRKLVQILQK